MSRSVFEISVSRFIQVVLVNGLVNVSVIWLLNCLVNGLVTRLLIWLVIRLVISFLIWLVIGLLNGDHTIAGWYISLDIGHSCSILVWHVVVMVHISAS